MNFFLSRNLLLIRCRNFYSSLTRHFSLRENGGSVRVTPKPLRRLDEIQTSLCNFVYLYLYRVINMIEELITIRRSGDEIENGLIVEHASDTFDLV